MAAKKHPELTTMTGMAIAMVLFIHAGSSYLGTCFPGLSYLEAGKLLQIFSLLVSPAVPMFIFLAGYKYALHDSKTPYGEWLKKRLPRVLMSFFIINTFFWVLDSIVWMERVDLVLLLKTYISSWMGNTVAYPLWYIPMYCCVVIACPLVCRVIPWSGVRLGLYFLVAAVQQIAADAVPALGGKPWMFVAYPLFFELGIRACERNWREKLDGKYGLPVLTAACFAVLTYVFPQTFSVGITEYLCDIMGVIAVYTVCLGLRHNRVLHWLAGYSYPIFLLHEPLIGRCTGALLREAGVSNGLAYISLWFGVVLVGTLCVIWMLMKLGINKVLWEFRIKNVRNLRT